MKGFIEEKDPIYALIQDAIRHLLKYQILKDTLEFIQRKNLTNAQQIIVRKNLILLQIQSNMNKFTLNAEKQEERVKYFCDECEKYYYYTSNLKKHKQFHNEINKFNQENSSQLKQQIEEQNIVDQNSNQQKLVQQSIQLYQNLLNPYQQLTPNFMIPGYYPQYMYINQYLNQNSLLFQNWYQQVQATSQQNLQLQNAIFNKQLLNSKNDNQEEQQLQVKQEEVKERTSSNITQLIHNKIQIKQEQSQQDLKDQSQEIFKQLQQGQQQVDEEDRESQQSDITQYCENESLNNNSNQPPNDKDEIFQIIRYPTNFSSGINLTFRDKYLNDLRNILEYKRNKKYIQLKLSKIQKKENSNSSEINNQKFSINIKNNVNIISENLKLPLQDVGVGIPIFHQNHIDFLINGYLYFYEGKVLIPHQLSNDQINPDQCFPVQEMSHIQSLDQLNQIYEKIEQQSKESISKNDLGALENCNSINCCCNSKNQMGFENHQISKQSHICQCGRPNNSKYKMQKIFEIENIFAQPINRGYNHILEYSIEHFTKDFDKIFGNQNENYNENDQKNKPCCQIKKDQVNTQEDYKCFCKETQNYTHRHGNQCGHPFIWHNDHIDFIVNNVLHHVHDSHCDNHGKIFVFNQDKN